MSIEMVLNDLSLPAQTVDVWAARQHMAGLVEVLSAATKADVGRVLRTHQSIWDIELAPDYRIARWRNDPQVDRDVRTFFKTLTTKAPYLDDIAERAVLDRQDQEDVFFSGEQAQGLAAALWLDALAVSLGTAPAWDVSRLDVTVRTLDAQAMLNEDVTTVPHASRSEHLLDHHDWIHDRRTSNLASGLDLWERRTELFPALAFCATVQDNLSAIRAGDPKFHPVKKRLLELQNYASAWQAGPFDDTSIPRRASTESEATLQEFGKERTFICPDGVARLFSWHLRITPGAYRIHFIPTPQHTIIVGYIGPHLRIPTA